MGRHSRIVHPHVCERCGQGTERGDGLKLASVVSQATPSLLKTLEAATCGWRHTLPYKRTVKYARRPPRSFHHRDKQKQSLKRGNGGTHYRHHRFPGRIET